MEVKLLITHGKSNIKEVILTKETIIGRGAECNLKIASSQVSRRHCRVTVTENSVLVRDLGSANGTILNGKPVPQNQDIPVTPGNALVVGPLKFVVQFKPPVSKSAAAKGAPAAATAAAAAAIQKLATPQESDTETVDYVPGKKKPAATAPVPKKPAVPPPDADDEQDIFHEEPTLKELPETSLESPVNPLEAAEAADEPPDTEFDLDMAKAAAAPINPIPEDTPTVAFTPDDEAAVAQFPGEETLNDGQFSEDTIREQPMTFAEASDDEEEEIELPPVKEKKKWGLFGLFRRKKAEPESDGASASEEEEPAAEAETALEETGSDETESEGTESEGIEAAAEADESAEAGDGTQEEQTDDIGPPADEESADEPAASENEEEGGGKSDDDDALKAFLGQF